MNLKDILVHIDNRETCSSRLEAAIGLAQKHQAHLTGLYVEAHAYYAPRHHSPEELVAEARDLFAARTADAGVPSEWICVDSTATGLGVVEAVNLHAYYRDLVILSQTDVDSGDRSMPQDLPERAVLGAGRPVLIVPYAGRFETIGERVLLAWRGGPESARAVNDAMPLLQPARSIKVLSVQNPAADVLPPHQGDICSHLGRHGVSAVCENVMPGPLSVGDMLLNHAAEAGADLMVMGAFSQVRRGLPSLGEVGRHLLKYMTVPVLMSH